MEAIDTLTGRVSPVKLGDPGPSKEQLDRILTAAARAPDHGKMRPWRFIVIEGESRGKLGDLMAQSLKRRKPDATAESLDMERNKAFRSPMIILVTTALKNNPKIPDIEQISAVAASAQNMLLATHAVGLGGMWKTGDFVYDDEVKKTLGVEPSDHVIGVLYVGSIAVPGTPRIADIETVTRHW